jgi:hypothetical protein
VDRSQFDGDVVGVARHQESAVPEGCEHLRHGRERGLSVALELGPAGVKQHVVGQGDEHAPVSDNDLELAGIDHRLQLVDQFSVGRCQGLRWLAVPASPGAPAHPPAAAVPTAALKVVQKTP